MDTKLDKRKAFIINFLYFIIAAGVLYFCLTRLFPIFLPFILGLAVAALLNPLIRFLCRKTGLGRKLWSPVAVVFFYAVIGVLVYVFGARILAFIQDKAAGLPAYYSSHIEPQLTALMEKLAGSFPDNQESLLAVGDSVENAVQEVIQRVSGAVISWGATFVVSFPSLLLQVLFAVISSFFFTADLDSVTALLSNEMFRDGGTADLGAPQRVAAELADFAHITGNTVFVSDYIYSDAMIYDDLTEAYRKGLALIDRTLADVCGRVAEVAYGFIRSYKQG